ncbi:MAG TPA: AAA family ATPase [Candidatus Babeliales bacterium]|nr:AAA family ATPase [Candidatus Babeliales bacterium]
MKLTNRINILLLCVIASAPSIVTSSIYANPKATPTEEKASSESTHQENSAPADRQLLEDTIELHLRSTLELYKKFDFALENLAQVINNNQIRGCDKTKALEHIKMLRFNIAQLQGTSALVNDPMSIKLLNVIFKGLADHLRFVIKQNFTQFPEPQLEDLIKNTVTRNAPSIDSLKLDIEVNEKLMNSIDVEANRVGLSLFNRAYRRVEKFANDHTLLSKGGALLAAGVLAYLLIANLPDKIAPEWFTAARKNTIGQAPKVAIDGTLANEDHLNKAGWIQYYGQELGFLKLTLPPMITWELIRDPLKERFDETKKWMSRKWENVRAYLRGGPVVRKTDPWMIDPRYRFKDIIGKDHIKDQLSRIVEYFRNREKFNRSGMKPPKGFLFAGDTRTGKTFMAEAFAGELKDAFGENFNFLSFVAADILRDEHGLSRVMFYARYYAPCVLFIDEIDMLGAQRDKNAALLSQLLTAMSGVTTDEDDARPVIMLAATNAPQNLDYALLQPGRFEKTLWFMHPTLEERQYFLHKELDKIGIMTVDADYLKKLAQETESISFEALRRIIATALHYAKTEGESLNEFHLERAFDEETRLILFEDPRLPAHEKHLVAIHQAGHALATMLLESSQSVAKVTICPVNIKPKEEPTWMKYVQENEKQRETVENGKVFTCPKDGKGTYNSHDELIAQCKIDLAGHVAEKLILGNSGYTYHRHDNQKALAMAKYIVFKGIKESELPKEQCKKLQEEAYQLMNRCEKEVSDLLMQHKDKIEITAQALEKYLSLSGYHLELIMQGKPLTKPEASEQPTEADAPSPSAESAPLATADVNF